MKFTLREIANWTSTDSEVTIPALQRGLVWKPSQVELLWDSILRGFPIGSFMLSDIVRKEQKRKYYLMDGQQRYNAISIGYNTVKDARAVLWVDLKPPTIKKSTRVFWIKATTIPHPWGFKNDDDCTRLSTSEKRQALDRFELKGNIYNRVFSLKETWPVEANCPIPLWCLLEAINCSRDDADTFLLKAIDIFKSTDFAYRKKIEPGEIDLHYIKTVLFPSIRALDNYYINCNLLPKEVLETETETIVGTLEQTTLEVLFTRLNTGGTAISRDDLNYSAIKAYWPAIKDINDNLAEKYMSPSKLVMLAFRLALTDKEENSLKNELSIRQIRNYARTTTEREKIERLYTCHYLEEILDRIDVWLGIKDQKESVSRTPCVLRTIIARNSPDVYLLLMFFAYTDIKSPIELTAPQIKALAFFLHWFSSYNEKKGCVQEIFERCKKGITLSNIQEGISWLMHDSKILHIFSPEEVKSFITNIGQESNWRVGQKIPATAQQFFNRIFWNRNAEAKEMLIYAEREYINTHFANYDPARQDLWEEYNRPWDFDHIIAKNRIDRRRGHYREYDKIWLNSIGNFAAISFESNRSKSDGEYYDEYHNNIESLVYDKRFEDLTYDITYDSEASVKFAEVTFDRFCNIYAQIYNIIQPVIEQTILSEGLLQRKNIFLSLKKFFPEGQLLSYVAYDEDDHFLAQEREQDWTREWLGVGVVQGDFMAYIEWRATFDENTKKPIDFIVGIRKAPGTKITKENMAYLTGKELEEDSLDAWWYEYEDVNSTNIEDIKNQFNYYLEKIKNLHY